MGVHIFLFHFIINVGGKTMNKELFSKKIMRLRKKYHLTQQELADKLNISNKTVSRWETGESYPDIELLPLLAQIFHVSVDYLLSDHEDYQDIDKSNIVSYIPWIIGIFGILVYYIFINLSIPTIFSFAIYFFIIKFSYSFLNKYTDKKNNRTLTLLNTASGFFVLQSMIMQILSWLMIAYIAITFSTDFQTAAQFLEPSNMISYYLLSYLASGIYAYFHYKKHIKKLIDR